MRNAPCYICQRHSDICHAQCREYHDWAAALKKEREAAKKAKHADAHTRDTIEINLKRAHTIRQVGQR